MSELEWMDIFGDNLRDALKDARMSQRELAEATGLHETTISRYIHKTLFPSLQAVINIAYALDMSLDELVDFGEPIDI